MVFSCDFPWFSNKNTVMSPTSPGVSRWCSPFSKWLRHRRCPPAQVGDKCQAVRWQWWSTWTTVPVISEELMMVDSTGWLNMILYDIIWYYGISLDVQHCPSCDFQAMFRVLVDLVGSMRWFKGENNRKPCLFYHQKSIFAVSLPSKQSTDWCWFAPFAPNKSTSYAWPMLLKRVFIFWGQLY